MSTHPLLPENGIHRIHRRLDDLVHKCGEMDHKLNLLLAQSNINYGSDHHNTPPAGNMGWGGLSHFGESILAHPYPIVLNSSVPSIHTLLGTSHDHLSSQAPPVPPPPTPGMYSASIVSGDGMWMDPPPDSVPPPPSTFNNEIRSPRAYDDEDNMYESFPGGGHNNHQSTSQWTGGPAQEAGPSTSLVIAKPDSIKNDTPSESSIPIFQNSKRAERDEQKSHYMKQICEGLGIVWTGNKLADLQATIGGLGWTVPKSGYTAGREWGRDKACAACFEELRKHVGPRGKRIIETKVLRNVLAKVRGEKPRAGLGPGQIVFAL